MDKHKLPASGTRRARRLVAAAATTAVALSVAGFASAPAQSAPDAACPSPYPIDGSATLKGLAVHALTVTSGTTPDSINGSVIGVMDNGIAPGVPMVLVRMDETNPTVQKYGIWAGMSGSPVYTDDGRLLGAVSYGFSAAPSSIAGVTPAADMEALLTATPGSGSTSTTMARHVTLPKTLSRQIVASGAATDAQVSAGASLLKTPFGISGLSAGKRLDQLAQRLHLTGVAMMKSSGGGTTSSTSIPITPGGNLAASISYGDVTAAGIGTATAVCGNEVLAFGHPMTFAGASRLTMHGADALAIQDDATFGSFKLANIGAPVGVIDQDRMAGLHGVVGTPPGVAPVTSTVTVGTKSRTGMTNISVPDATADLSLAHVVADQDRVLDSVGGGSGTFSYTVNFTRGNGSHQTFRRTDVYADPSDISYGDVWDFANLVYTLAQNDSEKVTIDSVTTMSNLTRTYQHYRLSKVEFHRTSGWHQLHQDRTLLVNPGSVGHFRITLTSPQLGTRRVYENVTFPSTLRGKFGMLQVFGGNTGTGMDGEGDMYAAASDNASSSDQPTLDAQLAALQKAPHHDDLRVDTTWYDQRERLTNHRIANRSLGEVVDGSFSMALRGYSSRG